jgi:hypothetical protein
VTSEYDDCQAPDECSLHDNDGNLVDRKLLTSVGFHELAEVHREQLACVLSRDHRCLGADDGLVGRLAEQRRARIHRGLRALTVAGQRSPALHRTLYAAAIAQGRMQHRLLVG